MQLNNLNKLTIEQASQRFLQCCTSEAWIEKMVGARPYSNAEALFNTADTVWQTLNESDYLQAFDGHPKIGDVGSLKEKYLSTKELASNEQASVADASDKVIETLAQKNADYLDKFGFIFIVFATGKTALEMLELLVERLPNDRPTELNIAAEEQRKIFNLRLEKLLEEQS